MKKPVIIDANKRYAPNNTLLLEHTLFMSAILILKACVVTNYIIVVVTLLIANISSGFVPIHKEKCFL